MVEFDAIKIKDQLGRPENKNIIVKRFSQDVVVEANTVTMKKNYDGHSFILGHTTNGVLGTANGIDGSQIVLGEANRSIVLHRVFNPTDVYREHFRDTNFQDTDEPNTADWDTTNFRLAMSTSANHATVYNTIAQSESIRYNDGTTITATLSCTETKWNPADLIKYYLTANGGATWEVVTKNTQHTFTVTGTDLKYRVIFFGNGGKDTYIEDLQVSYT